MATPIQIIAALTIENTYHILYPTAPINYSQFDDITDWAGLGYSTGAGDVVKGIFKVIDPAGQVIYENSGYATDDFSSQDWDLTDLTAPQFNLLTYTGTNTPIYGDYQFLWKVQVTPNGLSAFVVGKTFIVGLSNQLSPVLTLEDVYDCAYATFTSTDTTTYGAPAGYTIQTIAKTHVTRPPLVSKKSDGVTAQPTVTSSSTTNLLAAPNNPLWTGSYSSSIAAVVTYKSGNNYTIVNCPAVEKDTNVVCDTSLCKLFCYLKKLYTKYFDFLTVGNTVEAQMALAKWQKGSDIFMLIWKATTCSTGDVESLTQKFYDVTGFSAGCDCGCDGDLPAPVIPTNVINGTNGTDGLTPEFRVTGTLFQWRYTTGGGWTTLFDFSTITGTNGANGSDGTTLLLNDNTNSVTVTNDWEGWSAKTCVLDHTDDSKNLVSVGDQIKIYARFKCDTPNVTTPQQTRLTLNGTVQILGLFTPSFYNKNVIEIFSVISKLSNTTASVISRWQFGDDTSGLSSISFGNFQMTRKGTIALLDTTSNDNVITAQANDNGVDVVTCEAMSVEILKMTGSAQSPQTNIKYMPVFTTISGTTLYSNVIGALGKNLLRVYLDGQLLTSSDWSYNNLTDTLTFNIAITGASEVAGDYV